MLAVFALLALMDSPKQVGDFVFVPSQVICQKRLGAHWFVGYIDSKGNFIIDPKIPPSLGFDKEGPFSLMERTDLNKMLDQDKNLMVYEFRSGVLIPGIIKEHKFIPAVDGKIIRFKDYHYSPTVRSIYNLPGKFERRPVKK